jgi:hypothetical protein
MAVVYFRLFNRHDNAFLTYFGKAFGMSSNLRSLCSLWQAWETRSLFDFDWKAQRWNLVVVVGAMLGGFIAVHFMGDPQMLR